MRTRLSGLFLGSSDNVFFGSSAIRNVYCEVATDSQLSAVEVEKLCRAALKSGLHRYNTLRTSVVYYPSRDSVAFLFPVVGILRGMLCSKDAPRRCVLACMYVFVCVCEWANSAVLKGRP